MRGNSGIAILKARLGRDTELVARLAAPLWARVGRIIGVEDLFWTRGLAGDDAPSIVWRALEEAAGTSSCELRLSAECVTHLCSSLISSMGPVSPSDGRDDHLPRLVWTLPLAHISHASRGSTYREAIGDLIAQAREQLILVAPFIDSAGISGLLKALLTRHASRGERYPPHSRCAQHRELHEQGHRGTPSGGRAHRRTARRLFGGGGERPRSANAPPVTLETCYQRQ